LGIKTGKILVENWDSKLGFRTGNNFWELKLGTTWDLKLGFETGI
jgi:hypothetical protein